MVLVVTLLLSSFRDPKMAALLNPWMGWFHAPLLQNASAITEKLQLATRSIFFPRHDVGGNQDIQNAAESFMLKDSLYRDLL
jgi:hypothetical protein